MIENQQKPVFCPWFGIEMFPQWRRYADGLYRAWYVCVLDEGGCSARSPMCSGWLSKERALEAAYAAAIKRYEPPRTPIKLTNITWLGVPYFAEYKGVEKLFLYVTGDGIRADFDAARELGWEGETLGEFWEWEKAHGKLQVRLWEAKHSPPTDEERAAAPWEGEPANV